MRSELAYSFASGRTLPSAYIDALESGELSQVTSEQFARLFGLSNVDPAGPPFGFHFVPGTRLTEDSFEQRGWRSAPVDVFRGTDRHGSRPGSIDLRTSVLLVVLDIDLAVVWLPATESGSVVALQDPPQPTPGEWAPHWIEIAPSLDAFLADLLDSLR